MKSKRFLLTTLMAMAWLTFPASALATSPPTIISGFFPNSIGVGNTSTLSYAITDPPGNGNLTGVGFTDGLPSGVVVDTPNGQNISSGCNPTGGAPTLTATSGTATITFAGATVKPGRTDTATVTNGSATVTDSSITSGDKGRLVTGTGIPPFTYVGTVTSGTSFQLSSSTSVQSDVPASADGSGSVTISPACIVSVNVTSNTAGVYSNDTGTVSSNEGGTGNSDTESLTVLNPPTVTITSPTNNATYRLGQSVLADYSCQDDPNGPGLQQGGCQGNVASGKPINTASPGRKSFNVTAISQDGQVAFKTVYYTVLASNQFTIKNLYASPNGRIGLDIEPQYRGKFAIVEHAVIKGQSGQKPALFGQLSGTVNGAQGFVVVPSASGQAMVKQVRSANHNGQHGQILVTVAVTFTPAGGGPSRTQTYHVTVSP